jgi:hypothetical protein
MNKPIPREIDNSYNIEILSELKGASCHSDIIEPIQSHLKRHENVIYYCPDGKNFSYICWYVNNIIFAYASGMQKVAIRLSQNFELDFEKLSQPRSYEECSNWYSVPYDSEKLDILVKSAYLSAKKS